MSPKGLDSLRIIDAHTVAYLDFVGSGAETIAHIRENGRVVLMMCAFEGFPKTVRLHGRGEVVEAADPEFLPLKSLFDSPLPARSIIRVQLERVSESCGFGVPLYEFKGDRTQLPAWTRRKGEEGLLEYQRQHNRCSIDGLPALTARPGAGSLKPEL